MQYPIPAVFVSDTIGDGYFHKAGILDPDGYPVALYTRCAACGHGWPSALSWLRCSNCNHDPYWEQP